MAPKVSRAGRVALNSNELGRPNLRQPAAAAAMVDRNELVVKKEEPRKAISGRGNLDDGRDLIWNSRARNPIEHISLSISTTTTSETPRSKIDEVNPLVGLQQAPPAANKSRASRLVNFTFSPQVGAPLSSDGDSISGFIQEHVPFVVAEKTIERLFQYHDLLMFCHKYSASFFFFPQSAPESFHCVY